MQASSKKSKTEKDKPPRIRRTVEACIIGAACTFLGIHAYRKVSKVNNS